MTHVFEAAATGRSKCRGCGERIAAGVMRFGEVLPNPFADGEMTQWFHLDCGAFRRPEPFLQALAERDEPLAEAEALRTEAQRGLDQPRLQRVNGAGRSPTARAQCRSCQVAIPKDAWRIALVFYEEGRFSPGGFVHAGCAPSYFETPDILTRVRRFSPDLGKPDWTALEGELAAGPSTPPTGA
jgi:hypothetical protein